MSKVVLNDRVVTRPGQTAAPRGVVDMPVVRVTRNDRDEVIDSLAVEEPMEIRIAYRAGPEQRTKTVAITMRTPGHDVELALGFLYGEGILAHRDDVRCTSLDGLQKGCRAKNLVSVELHDHVAVELGNLERNFYTTSSCGVCGKTSMQALSTAEVPALSAGSPKVAVDLIHRLPELLRAAQSVFDCTGGLHASGLFAPDGTLQHLREDVGRHNALDKLIGRQLLDAKLPLTEQVLVLSGRASFELMQKAARAGIAVVVAIGAPSSLAVRMAGHHGITLIGFARAGRFNIYSEASRIA